MAGRLEVGAPGGADAVVWLDLPRATVMRRVIGRSLRRGLTREEMWHGNRERVSTWFRLDPERNIIRWAWVQHPLVRDRMLARIAAGEPIIHLRSPREVDAWIAEVRRSARNGGPGHD